MDIKILGSGCRRCKTLAKDVEDVVNGIDLDIRVEKVEKMEEILKYNILRTPGLVIDGKLISSGRVPSKSEIKKWIQERADK
ncbi:MAG: thioredoxin family protein [Desulfotomaculaceae bacterium]